MSKTVVYFVESKFFGGSEVALLQLMGGLDRSEWQPVLFHRPEPGIVRLIERATEMDVKTQVVPWLINWHAPAQLIEFARLLRAEHPAIFHASLHWPTACKVGLLAASLAQVPAIVATVQLFVECALSRGLILQQRLAATQVDRYIAVSDAMTSKLTRVFQIPQRKIRVVHNGVSMDRFNCPANPQRRDALTAASNHPIVLTVARLDQAKGLSYLLEAATLVPEAVFVLVGDGPERMGLEQQARQLNIADRVVFLGHCEDIPELLASCDIFVLPSIYEGLPLSVLEAMAAGKPVIATAIDGMDEVITDKQTGILVPPAQPRALAQAILELVYNPLLAQKLACAGKTWVGEKFSVETMVRTVTEIYKEVL